MSHYNTILHQLLALLPRHHFDNLIQDLGGDHYIKTFSPGAWQIEIFFKWIKQNLKIKSFLGTSKNAGMTQIWVAMSYYLLLAYLKFHTSYKFSLFYLHRLVKETLMDRLSLANLPHLNEVRLRRLRSQGPQLCFQF